jgi:glycosyltransferase involved in cell wall biosynthesis
MTRILLLVKGLGRGGAETLLAAAAPHLDRARFGYEVAYLLPHKDALVEDLRRAGVPARCLGRGPAWLGRLRRAAVGGGFDIVHAHSPAPAAGARVALPGAVRHVYTEHNVWESYHPATRWANAATLARNDHVFAVSDRVRRSLRRPDRRRPPIETLHHGVDLEVMGRLRPHGVRDELGIAPDAPLVGMVGNFRADKGHRHLLGALPSLRRSIPELRVVLVGRGPEEARERRRAAALGVDEMVIFAGFRPDAARIAGALDLFVLPSVHEGLPIALVEAMAQGVPAVCSSVGGVPEVVRHGEEGLLVPPGDVPALAGGIAFLLGHPEVRMRMGAGARQRAAGFDIRRAVVRMEEVYAGLAR